MKDKAFKKVNPKFQEPVLNNELIERIANNLRAGAYIETAVVVCGVSKASFYRWMSIANGKFKPKEGEDPPSEELTELCLMLQDAVERGQEEATMRDLLNIEKAAMGKPIVYERDENGRVIMDAKGNPVIKEFGMKADWSASAWRLERRRPKEWSRTEKQEVTVKDNNLEVEFVDSDEGPDENQS